MSVNHLIDRMLVEAELEVERRRRAGSWEGGLKAMEQYQHDPVGFAVKELGIERRTIVWSENEGYEGHQWDGTPDPLVALTRAMANSQDVGAEAGTGTCKSFTIGWAQLWYLASYQGARCFSFASKEEQLDAYSWTEMRKLFPKFNALFPLAVMQSLKLFMAGPKAEGEHAGWEARGRSAGVGADEEISSKAAGMHAPRMMVIGEEAQGIPTPVSRAIEHTLTGKYNFRVYVGNPDHQQDALHEFCTSPGVVHIRISALDNPNWVVNEKRDPERKDLENDEEIIPGAVGRRKILQTLEKYGEGHRFYQSRVRGISPTHAQDALISWDWCEAAAGRYNDPEFRAGARALGADVADSPDGDRGAIARFQGACVTEVESFACPDANVLGRRIALEVKDPESELDPRYVAIDSVGVGAGAVNEMKRLGVKVRSISGARRAVPGMDEDDLWSETSTDFEGNIRPKGPKVIEAERFDNLRSQVWWRLREDLRLARIALPNDVELFRDLTLLKFETKNGKISVESKGDAKKRLGRSPDRGDAVAYGNWVRRRAPVNLKVGGDKDWGTAKDTKLEKWMNEEEKREQKERKARRRLLRGRL